MAGRFCGVIAGVTALALSLAMAPSASATSCAAPPPGYDPFRNADLVAEGVLLSGPSRDGILFSPGRLAVTRYVKGSGPRVLRVGTLGRQVLTGNVGLGFATIAGTSFARVGEAWRIFGYPSPRDRRSNDGGVTLLGAACGFDNRLLRPTQLLSPVSGTLHRSGAGARRWRAQLFRGRHGIRCLRVGLRPKRTAAHAECKRGARGPLLVVRSRGEGNRATTAISLAARGLRSISVSRGGIEVGRAPAGARGVALAVLEGPGERAGLEIVARYADGSLRHFGRAAFRAVAPVESGSPAWAADLEPRRGAGPCVTLVQPAFPGFTTNDGKRSGECARRREAPFLAVRRSFIYSDDSPDPVGSQTLVFGSSAATVSATGVSVRTPSTETPAALSGRGGVFLAVLPGSVPPRDLTVSLRCADGTVRTWSGRRSVNVAPPRREDF